MKFRFGLSVKKEVAKNIYAKRVKEQPTCFLSRATYSDASSSHMQHFKFFEVVLNTFYFSLSITLRMVYGKHYHPHFTDWEICSEMLGNLPKVTE